MKKFTRQLGANFVELLKAHNIAWEIYLLSNIEQITSQGVHNLYDSMAG